MKGEIKLVLIGNNTGYVAARAKSRRSSLLDRTRLRQLIQQSPEQLPVSIGDNGYRAEIDLYAGRYSGADLVEAALTHNLQSELASILKLCSGSVRELVEVYTGRFRYHNAKVVLRAVVNDVEIDKVRHSILPEESEINAPWLKMIEESSTIRDAAEQMRRLPFGKDLLILSSDAKLVDYENALDRHYFKNSLRVLSGGSPEVRMLRESIQMEIDHRNITNILEGQAFGLSSGEISDALVPGGRIVSERTFAQATSGRSGLMDLLRQSNRFDSDTFSQVLQESDDSRTLDPVITWLRIREHDMMKRMSYLHPISALPVIHYVASKIEEVDDLRLIVRGRMAGLPTEVIEAHVL
tara:strand:- start:13860 stop:14918 length:1059 start_codon:yes stop_codon:yes gene_type:complete